MPTETETLCATCKEPAILDDANRLLNEKGD
jgi:hypothetical protein